MLFHGPPGTGKTTTIMACARQMYGKMAPQMTLELNASDERGIDVARDTIKNFVSMRHLFAQSMSHKTTDQVRFQVNRSWLSLTRPTT
jgi:replication factor C subunit 3/5